MVHVPDTKNDDPLSVPLGDEGLALCGEFERAAVEPAISSASHFTPMQPGKDNCRWFKQALWLADSKISVGTI